MATIAEIIFYLTIPLFVYFLIMFLSGVVVIYLMFLDRALNTRYADTFADWIGEKLMFDKVLNLKNKYRERE